LKVRLHVAALAGVFIALSPARVFAATNCPPDTIGLLAGNSQTIVTSDPHGSYGAGAVCVFSGSKSTTVTYNLTFGTFHIVADAGTECGAEGRISTHDTFTLTGPTSSSALSFTAHLSKAFGGFGSRYGQASLSVGQMLGVVGPNSDIVLPITINVGDSFDLSTTLLAGVSAGHSDGSTTLTFTDLPAGYQVASCQGFIGSSPVPVSPISWGRVKLIYR
jgi:hypothetical protein